ncbi:hypothetical protein Aca07nite_70890 [Actinoplanes capillaceus]|uniref:Uncharacterized protein n=1 Tax=Actinoplanes campanulatus TaxID=113559 RepID=A0ABQ3WUE2_9ACTN|nr:hypothetical protein [Actinoplanes capillaceus]GID49814.1 hypothetical protein Aca07nite_70890 [Actinoplanes capillaceus]
MTVTTTLRAAGLATVAALSITQLGLSSAAHADEGAAPAAITAWFSGSAPATAATVLGSGATEIGEADGTSAADRPASAYRTGIPVRLHDWNPAFVAGDTTTAVVGTSEWVAPLYRDGAVVGTIAATLDASGDVRMSYVDDDQTAGAALASGAVSGDVVQDPQLGGLVEVAGGGRANGLSAVTHTRVDTGAVAELRDLVTEAHDPDSWAPDVAGSGSGSEGAGAGSGQIVFGGLVAAAVLVLWQFTGRRTSA